MDCIKACETRRSVRAYTGEPVTREVLADIVDCGGAATARNRQPWEFVVVTDPKMLGAIAAVAEFGGFIAQAAACIVVLCREVKYFLEDGANASQNMLVAARAHGLGACWVAGDKKEYAETVARMVGAPESCRLISLIPIGHPAEKPRMEKRQLATVLHWEKY